MNIKLIKNQKAESRNAFINTTPLDRRFGFWGVVTEVHPENCTVHVRMDNGNILFGVRVASLEWVTIKKDKHLTGERHLPPVNTYVFCLMPNGETSSAFVLCSGFARQQSVHADFMNEGEDYALTWERVQSSGWYKKTDYRNGTINIKNKTDDEPTICIDANQEDEGDEKVKIIVHGTEINITKDDGINIKTDKNINVEQEGDLTFTSKGTLQIEAEKELSFKCSKSELLEIGNSIATLGSMISELIQEISTMQTFGSPSLHSVMPGTVAKLNAIKAKWNKVFK